MCLEAKFLEKWVNEIKVICKDAFVSASSLRRINLKRNKLRRIKKDIFLPLVNLETLFLDQNYLEDINGILSSVSSLKYLSISQNNLKWFDMAFFTKTVQTINMSRNFIEEIGNYYKMLEGF